VLADSNATKRSYAVFDETGEEREILKWCDRCQADSDYTIVSPGGTAHYSNDTGERTRCGIKATDDGWWHRL